MSDAPEQPKPRKPRTVRKRKRFVPNAKPGYEGLTIEPAEKPQPIAVKAPADRAGLSRSARSPCSALSIDDGLSEDTTGLTAKERKWWRHGAGVHRRITDDHKRRFLDCLAKFPSVAEAARKSGFSIRSWFHVRSRDPAFAAAWESAVKAAVPVLERAAYRRAFEGTERPIYQNGVLVGHERQYSDRLAEVLLRAHDPERYSEKLMVSKTINGTINHVHHLSPALEAMAAKVLAVGGPVVEGKALPVDQAPDLVAQVMGRVSLPKPQDVVSSEAQTVSDDINSTDR